MRGLQAVLRHGDWPDSPRWRDWSCGSAHDVEISAEGTFYGNIGIKGGPAPVRHYDIDGGLLDAVLKGEINPGRVFTAEYDLDHIQDAYEAMDQRKVIKALIRF